MQSTMSRRAAETQRRPVIGRWIRRRRPNAPSPIVRAASPSAGDPRLKPASMPPLAAVKPHDAGGDGAIVNRPTDAPARGPTLNRSPGRRRSRAADPDGQHAGGDRITDRSDAREHRGRRASSDANSVNNDECARKREKAPAREIITALPGLRDERAGHTARAGSGDGLLEQTDPGDGKPEHHPRGSGEPACGISTAGCATPQADVVDAQYPALRRPDCTARLGWPGQGAETTPVSFGFLGVSPTKKVRKK